MRWFFQHSRTGADDGVTRRFVDAMDEVLDTGSEPPASDSAWDLGMIAFVEPVLLDEPNEDVLARILPWVRHVTRRSFRYELEMSPHARKRLIARFGPDAFGFNDSA
jgi:hypothetical protein